MNARVNCFFTACAKISTFNFCKTLKDNTKKYVCEVEDCDETCGTTYCRLKVGNTDVCVINKIYHFWF